VIWQSRRSTRRSMPPRCFAPISIPDLWRTETNDFVANDGKFSSVALAAALARCNEKRDPVFRLGSKPI